MMSVSSGSTVGVKTRPNCHSFKVSIMHFFSIVSGDKSFILIFVCITNSHVQINLRKNAKRLTLSFHCQCLTNNWYIVSMKNKKNIIKK